MLIMFPALVTGPLNPQHYELVCYFLVHMIISDTLTEFELLVTLETYQNGLWSHDLVAAILVKDVLLVAIANTR